MKHLMEHNASEEALVVERRTQSLFPRHFHLRVGQKRYLVSASVIYSARISLCHTFWVLV